MATVITKELKKFYGNVRALDDVTLNIEEGTLLAVIGPSGSGKTTLLRSIAGFVKLDRGKIYIDKEDITHVSPEKRNISMFFQNYALWPHMTVYNNIAYGLKLRKYSKSKIDERIRWVARLLDIGGLENRKPSQLSGGQQQRIALARAIVVEPKVLLLDEPLSNLDAKIRLRIRFDIKALQQKLKLTTLYVTHDQEEALSIADRVAIMHDGKILQIGTPQEIYTSPTNLFVADFIGTNNVIKKEGYIKDGGKFINIGNLVLRAPSNVDVNKINVVFRADEVEIGHKDEQIDGYDYHFDGTISGKLYMGSKFRYEVTINDEKENIKVIVNSAKDFSIGENICVFLEKNRVFIY